MMRKFVLVVAILILIVAAAFWIWRGRDLALLTERFGTIEIGSEPVKSLSYEGRGTGGTFRINDLAVDLTPAKSDAPVPEIGTSKDGQVALAYHGTVFDFGKPTALQAETLATAPTNGDEANLAMRRSLLAWPTPFATNFMTGQSPSWKRLSYRSLIWKKSGGAKLEMVWRCEQFLYPNNGWSDASMTDAGVTGLIRVQISAAAR